MSHPAPPSTATQPLAPVTLWRLVIVFAALFGPYQIMGQYAIDWSSVRWEALVELSQLASVLVAVCYLGLALFPLFTGGKRHEPRSSWLRGALAVTMLLVCLTSIFVLGNGGQLDHNGFLFEHLVTPVLVVLDFIFVGRGQLRTKWWHPLTWIAIPLAYFAFMQYAGVYYGSLFDPASPTFLITVPAFFAGVIVMGFLLYGGAKLVGLVTSDGPEAALMTPPIAPAPATPVSAPYPTPQATHQAPPPAMAQTPPAGPQAPYQQAPPPAPAAQAPPPGPPAPQQFPPHQ